MVALLGAATLSALGVTGAGAQGAPYEIAQDLGDGTAQNWLVYPDGRRVPVGCQYSQATGECVGPGATEEIPAPSAGRGLDPAGKLDVWSTWGPGANYQPLWDPFFLVLEQSFRDKYPRADAKVSFVTSAGREIVTKYIATAAGGNPPDVMDVYMGWARQFIEQSYVLDLTDYVAQTPEVAMDQYIPAAQQLVQKAGRVYGVPWQVDTAVMLFNQDHLLASGLPTTSDALDKWTWDDLTGAVRRLTRRDGTAPPQRSGWAFAWGPGPTITGLTSFVQSNGGSVTDLEQTMPMFNTAAGIEALDMLRQLEQIGGSDLLSGRPGMSFQRGESSLYYGGVFQAASSSTVPGLHFDITQVPRGVRGTGQGGAAWAHMQAASSLTKQRDAAFAFMSHYCGKDLGAIMSEMGRVLSARLDAYNSANWKRVTATIPGFNRVQRLLSFSAPVLTAHSDEIRAEVDPLLLDAVLGKLSSRDTLNQMESIFRRLLTAPYK